MRTTLNVSNVLVADGANKAATLAGVPTLTDPGPSYQIAYAVHPYVYTDGRAAGTHASANWQARMPSWPPSGTHGQSVR